MPVGTMDYSQTVFEQSFIGNCLKKSGKEECTTSKEVKEEEAQAEEHVKEGQEFESEAKAEAEECTTSKEVKKEEAEGQVFDSGTQLLEN